MKRIALAVLALAALAASARAQQAQTRDKAVPSPGASEPGADVIVAAPSPVPPDLSPHVVLVPGKAASRDRDSMDAGPLKGVQARAVKSGEARLALSDGERTVHPGDHIGSDVVKSIELGRIVLTRTLAGGDEAVVVVSFDSAGRGRVRLYSGKDHSAVLPPTVR